MLARSGGRPGVLLVAAATIVVDRLTKLLATATLADAPGRSFFGDTLRLDYARNPGAFLGMGADWPAEWRAAIFTGAAFVGMAVVAALARRLRHSTGALVGLALFAAGTVSNLVDRVIYGSVVDFLNVGIGPVRTGIFNVADVAILGGAMLVLIFRNPPRPPPPLREAH